MSTGILISFFNILKVIVRYEVVEDFFYIVEFLVEIVLVGKVSGNKSIVIRGFGFNMYFEKIEKWDVSKVFSNEKDCRNCFYFILNVSSVFSLFVNVLVFIMFCEFEEDFFFWLNYFVNVLIEVVGFRMIGVVVNGDVVEIIFDVSEVYFVRKNLSFAVFNFIVGFSSDSLVDGWLKKIIGVFRFEVDSGVVKEVLVYIVIEVIVLFIVLVYVGG